MTRLHRDEHGTHAEHQLRYMIRLLLAAAACGAIRDDISLDEVASYFLHALASAADPPSRAAARRLVIVTLARRSTGI